MKIVHVLKRIETIDRDIKDLRKLEKSIQKDKSFSTPIYMTIEKQINLLVGERVKLLELQISNPPESLLAEFKDVHNVEVETPVLLKKTKKTTRKTKSQTKKAETKQNVTEQKPKPSKTIDDEDDDDIPFQMLTQNSIDEKIAGIKKASDESTGKSDKSYDKKGYSFEDEDEVEDDDLSLSGSANDIDDDNDDDVKLLDIALHKGSLSKDDINTEKKRVRFFRDNFPNK